MEATGVLKQHAASPAYRLDTHMRGTANDSTYGLTLLGLIAVITLYRLFVIQHSGLSLDYDEAYYFGWARSFEFGYYSKPPMIAWLIGLTTRVCGDGELCVKSGTLIAYPVIAWFVFLIGRRLFDARVGFWSSIALTTTPAAFFSALFITTDVVLIVFWTLALYFFVRAVEHGGWTYWLAAGIAGGLGMLSKYTMILFPLSALLYLAVSPGRRNHLREPKFYVAMTVALLVFSPNLLWNYYNEFVSFSHTAEISQLDRGLLHPAKMFEFLAGQFAVFGPVLMTVFVYTMVRARRLAVAEGYLLLLCFAVPFLAVITLQSLLARAHFNWAAPTYVAASVLVVGYLIHKRRSALLACALALNIALGLVIYHYHSLANTLDIELGHHTDPFVHRLGWRQVGAQVQAVLERYPDATLVADGRRVLAEIVYYVKPHPYDAGIWNPSAKVTDHYRLTADVAKRLGEDFVFVSANTKRQQLEGHFASVRHIASVNVPIYTDHVLSFQVYYAANFLGY